MINWLRRAGVLMLPMLAAVAFAQTTATKGPATGSAEAQVAARFAEKSGGMKPDQVFKSLGGLYEVLVGGQLYYVDSNVNFVIAGRMFDPRTREDLTQKRLDSALKVDFKALPFDQAIKTTRGDGSRTLVTFEDPNCPYCKRLWQNLAGMQNVTIYTFLYPILSSDSAEKSRAIWCAKDRALAWDQYMVANQPPPPAPADCTTPLEQNLGLGKQLGVGGTPMIIFTDGSRVAGAVPVATLEQRIAAAKK